MNAPHVSVLEKYKLPLATAAGAVGGMVLAGFVFLMTMGNGQAPETLASPSKPTSAMTAQEAVLQKRTEELIMILVAISRRDSHRGGANDVAGSSEYEECLKRCQTDFPGTDGQSRTLLLDCTKGCLLQYSLTMKEIRERFHGPESNR